MGGTETVTNLSDNGKSPAMQLMALAHSLIYRPPAPIAEAQWLPREGP